jgi:hypothetical protein
LSRFYKDIQNTLNTPLETFDFSIKCTFLTNNPFKNILYFKLSSNGSSACVIANHSLPSPNFWEPADCGNRAFSLCQKPQGNSFLLIFINFSYVLNIIIYYVNTLAFQFLKHTKQDLFYWFVLKTLMWIFSLTCSTVSVGPYLVQKRIWYKSLTRIWHWLNVSLTKILSLVIVFNV